MKLKTGLTMAATVAAGYGAWMAYKKYNPNAKEDMKKAWNQMTKKAEQSIENMM